MSTTRNVVVPIIAASATTPGAMTATIRKFDAPAQYNTGINIAMNVRDVPKSGCIMMREIGRRRMPNAIATSFTLPMLVSLLLKKEASARIVVTFTNSEGCPPIPAKPNQLCEPYARWPTARTAARATSDMANITIDER